MRQQGKANPERKKAARPRETFVGGDSEGAAVDRSAILGKARHISDARLSLFEGALVGRQRKRVHAR